MFGHMTEEEKTAMRRKWEKQQHDRKMKQEVERPVSTTESRYVSRAYNIWDKKRLGGLRHYFWWVVHNSVVHPLLGIAPCMATFRLHDWASRKLNGK